eukprot:scaffold31602_cov39-Phaeocystis_antarctica.AAC.1
MAGAARGGEAGAPRPRAGEAQQARAYVAGPSRHALNPHTERPCTLPYPQRATARRARYPCRHQHTRQEMCDSLRVLKYYPKHSQL